MSRNENILRYSLLAGAIYFACISIAHILGIKIPGLYIYYNIPSYQYQDIIISFLSFGWAAFFYSGSKNLATVKAIIVSAMVALIGLININVSIDFTEMSGKVSSTPYWLQTILLCFYTGWLIYFAFKAKKPTTN